MRSVRPLAAALLAVVTVLACESAYSKQTKQRVAGTYFQTSHDTALARRRGQSEQLLLRPDGRWVRTAWWDTVYRGEPAVDSGAYIANGPTTIVMRFTSGPVTWVIAGDTLKWLPAERDAMIAREEAMSGRKWTDYVETFYVRMREEP